MGNFGCGDGGWTLAMKIDGNKVQIIPHPGFKSMWKCIEFISYGFSFFFRKRFITILTFGATEMAIILLEARLALTYKRPSYRPTGRHPSPRSVLV